MPRKRRKKIKVDVLLGLMKRAEHESFRYGRLFDSPEDAGQEYALRIFEGLHQRATVGQAVCDMSRELMGRAGQPGYEAKKAVALALQTDPEDIHTSHKPFDIVNRRLFLERAMKRLSHDEKIVMLMFLEGYTYAEIGDFLDLSEGRISQLWLNSVERMKFLANR